MSQQSIVGQGTFIRGNVSGSGSLEIQGRIEGNVSMSGDVFIQPGALVKGNVSANQLSVAGSVAGNLTANEGLALEPGARVIGDLVGASIGIADGALVRGLVRTADEAPLASAKQQAAPAVKAPAPAQRPAMGGFGRPASTAHSHGSSPLATAKAAAMPAPFQRTAAATPKPLHVPSPAPAPVAAPPPPPPPVSVLPIEPESDVLESVNEDQTQYESDDAEFTASNDTAELGSAEKEADEVVEERHEGPPPPVAPALKKGQKAKKKGR